MVEPKVKTADSNIQSAFLKGNTIEQFLLFYPDIPIDGINKNERIKVKFELDINPAGGAGYETKFQLRPIPYSIKLYDQPSLFSGKIHAVLCRGWKNRVKGRDLYDYIFYLAKGTKFNLPYLREKLLETGKIGPEESITTEKIKNMLAEKFRLLDFEDAKEDVRPFIKDPAVLDIWSCDFFTQITENLEEEKSDKE